MTFDELLRHVPHIAEPIRDRFERSGIAILGTIRADGSPRVSPIEVTIQSDHLYLGMMPGSTKAQDVLRDPRCSLLTAIADRDDVAGEGKLFGRAEPIGDPDRATAILARAVADLDVDPGLLAGSPVFEIFVDGAAWQRVEGDSWVTLSWSEREGVRRRRREGPTGLPVEF